MSLHLIFPKLWKKAPNNPLIQCFLFIFSPLAVLYGSIVIVRKLFYYYRPVAKVQKFQKKENNFTKSYNVSVVGNLTSGGNNKTPMILYLAEKYLQQGKKIAIISRGYGRKKNTKQLDFIQIDTKILNESLSQSCLLYGDEPVMIFHRLQQKYSTNNFQIWIGSKRQELVQTILEQFPDVEEIISDDGLQHYAMYRDTNYIMQRQEQHQWFLPIGAFREPQFLRHLIMNKMTKTQIIQIEQDVEFKAMYWNQAHHDNNITLSNEFIQNKQNIHIIAGIANPQRFFKTLNDECNVPLSQQIHHILKDHQPFTHQWLQEFYESITKNTTENNLVLMTEKDYVKCHDFLIQNPHFSAITYYLVMELYLKIS